MSTAIKAAPRFRVGDWVVFPFGIRRVLAEIIEDRGPIGRHGRRLYRVRIDRSEPEPTTTEVPEEDLEPAPRKFLSLEAARESGISTEYWPRYEFEVTYVRDGKSNSWTLSSKEDRGHEGVRARGQVGYSTSRYELEVPGDERFAVITVLIEYDPRLRDPRDAPAIWQAMLDEARSLADRGFKTHHPKAVIKPD
jgi:hypothetical protein